LDVNQLWRWRVTSVGADRNLNREPVGNVPVQLVMGIHIEVESARIASVAFTTGQPSKVR